MRNLIHVTAVSVLLALLTGCGAYTERADRAQVAKAMFEERCKKAGFFIHRTVKDVEGILVMKIRPIGVNYGAQFLLSDPYGRDFGGEDYVGSFLRMHSWQPDGQTASGMDPTHLGFSYAEAIDPKDGVRYRYVGRFDEPWRTNAAALWGHKRFVVEKMPAAGERPRYGVTYDDISTRREREYWVAGSSLRVVDTYTGEVLAERIGYMWDPGQGNNSGGRSPWLHAARQACPNFEGFHSSGAYRPDAFDQIYQTVKFVGRVLEAKH